ncbi:MAG: hypothetical protein CMF50_10710 [Legionellales bacterium]|nr:hypothetical protein [Legionellales bacterium]|tara:strand:- start:13483 stop:14100 length:618 start_codon:yes stop_codon:yes gene_type:complete
MAAEGGARNKYFLGLCSALCLGLIVGIGVVIWFLSHQKVPGYAAIVQGPDKKTYAVTMPPLARPILTREAIVDWVEEAATTAYTYDFANYNDQLKLTMDTYFTPDGADQFMRALETSGAIKNLTAKQLAVSSVVSGTPVLLREGYLMGKYSWKYELPLLVTYQSASERQTRSLMVTILIVLVPPSESPKGIGIDQFLSRNYVARS